MSGLPWFKCYPRDFNDGLSRLTLEERGAYITIINHIYIRGGPVEDDPVFWRATLLCSGKAWAKIRAALLVRRRLFAVDVNGIPCLMDERCAREIQENEEMRRRLSERGSRGGRKAQANARENNDLAQAPAQAQVDLGSSTTEAESEADNTTVTNVPVVVRPPKSKAARRCPDDWLPSDADRSVGEAEGLSPGEIDRALAKMRDHLFKTARSDWSATFRNWLRADAERKPRNDRPSPDRKYDAKQQNYSAALTGSGWADQVLASRRDF